ETRKLLDYGFNNFEKKTILPAKSTVDALPEIEVFKGKQKKVGVVTETGVELIVKKGTSADQFTITAEPLEEGERTAPIESGKVLGKAVVTYTEADIPGLSDGININLIAAEEVEKASWFTLFFRAIGNFFADLFTSIKNIF